MNAVDLRIAGRPSPEEISAIVVALGVARGAGTARPASVPPPASPQDAVPAVVTPLESSTWARAARHEGIGGPRVAAPQDLRQPGPQGQHLR